MKGNLLPLAAVLAVLIGASVAVVLIFGSSGGGGSSSSLEGYFQTLNSVQEEISAQYSTISTQYPQAFQDKQETLDYLDASIVVWGDGAEKLKAIDPPGAAQQGHDGLVQATDDVRGAFEGLRPGAEDAADATALQDLLNNADTAAFANFTTACQALQDLADQNSIAVQLAC